MPHEQRSRPAGNGPAEIATAAKRQQPQGTALSLLDALTDDGQHRRDVGQQTATYATDVRVRSAIDSTIEDLANLGLPFTVEHVRRVVDPVATPNVLGARISAAASRDLIRHVGFVRAERPEAHGRWIMQWVGTEVCR